MILNKITMIYMKPLEIYDQIINGNLRPTKFEADGIKLNEEINKLGITTEEFTEYLNYLNKQGRKYRLIINNPDTGEKIYEEEKNENLNELIDIDIPPPPNKKGENYLEIIEFEYSRNLKFINYVIDAKSKTEIEESGIKLIIKLKNLWYELKHYEKLVKTGRDLDYKKDNDFVVMILKTHLERIAGEIIRHFRPFLATEITDQFYLSIFGERDQMIKEIEESISRIEHRKKMNVDKIFDDIFEKQTKAKRIEEKLFNEIEFWKNHQYAKIENIPQDELEFISKSMVENFESELKKARITGWIRGHKIEIEKAERLYGYMKEILSEYDINENKIGLRERLSDTEKIEAGNDQTSSQRNMIKEYLKENHPDFKSNPIDNISTIAEEIVLKKYPELSRGEKKKKVKSIRVELQNIRSGKISFDN
jgi:hypothetical protein